MDFLFAMFAIFSSFEAILDRPARLGGSGSGIGPIGSGIGPIGSGIGPIGSGIGPIG
jgi:hypothetical protein